MNCQNSPMEIKPYIMESDNQNFEHAFKNIFVNDNIIGEENEDNINIVVEDEINFHDTPSPEMDSTFNIKNPKIFGKEENEIEFQEKPPKVRPKIIEDTPNTNLDINIPNNNINNINSYVKEDNKDDITLLKKAISDMKIDSEIPEKKINPFRVYNSCEFNIFHPGGNSPSYNKFKEEIQDLDKIKNVNFNRFKVHKKNKIKRKRNKKEKIERKRKPDNIRKKIKSRFFKSLKIRINQLLKSAKSKESFDLLPQCFIINITKKVNKAVMNMTLKALFSCDFLKENLIIESKEDKNKMSMIDLKKYERNKKVIDYLENDNIIMKKSKFNIIGNMTFSEAFEEYLKSDEFEKEIQKLEKEGNDMNYIKDYIVKAFGFIKYFH